MASVDIKKVETKKDLKAFIELHYELYKGNKFDAPNLYSDELHTLSKDHNAAFEFCEAEYYMAYRDGRLVGRVAAIINHRYNEQWQRKAVRFGWIDLVDDAEVMFASSAMSMARSSVPVFMASITGPCIRAIY